MNSMDLGQSLDFRDRTQPGEATAPSDWTPEQQIARMLELCDAQLESAVCESDLAVDALVRTFTSVAETARALRGGIESGEHLSRERQIEQLDAISRQMTAAVIAFQFYDKLTQRLGHVSRSLSRLGEFVCDGTQAGRRDRWQALFSSLREQYRTEEERQIFRMIVEGASAEEAREHVHQTTMTLRPAPGGDIELF